MDFPAIVLARVVKQLRSSRLDPVRNIPVRSIEVLSKPIPLSDLSQPIFPKTQSRRRGRRGRPALFDQSTFASTAPNVSSSVWFDTPSERRRRSVEGEIWFSVAEPEIGDVEGFGVVGAVAEVVDSGGGRVDEGEYEGVGVWSWDRDVDGRWWER